MSHYNKKCPIDIENYGAIGPSTLSSFLITEHSFFIFEVLPDILVRRSSEFYLTDAIFTGYVRWSDGPSETLITVLFYGRFLYFLVYFMSSVYLSSFKGIFFKNTTKFKIL